MAYEIYITKKQNWFETGTASNISMEEWEAFVKNDPEMRLDNFSEVGLESGEMFRYDNPGAAIWFNPYANGEMVHFDFLAGNISVSSPDEDSIAKMKHIAFKLGAKVQGEDGELYTDPEVYQVPVIKPLIAIPSFAQAIKNRWSKLLQSVFALAGRREH